VFRERTLLCDHLFAVTPTFHFPTFILALSPLPQTRSLSFCFTTVLCFDLCYLGLTLLFIQGARNMPGSITT
jgi:hypothetical protein